MTSPLDSCRCGDWRFCHRAAGGYNLPGCYCGSFRLWQTEAEYAAEHPAHYATLGDLKRHHSKPG